MRCFPNSADHQVQVFFFPFAQMNKRMGCGSTPLQSQILRKLSRRTPKFQASLGY